MKHSMPHNNRAFLRRQSLSHVLWTVCMVLCVYAVSCQMHHWESRLADAAFTSKNRSTYTMKGTALQVHWICPEHCISSTALSERQSLQSAIQQETTASINATAIVRITHVNDVSPSSVDFDDPPLSIIGTDAAHAHDMSAVSIAEFVTHLRIWRDVFHDPSRNAAVVLQCGHVMGGDAVRAISSVGLFHSDATFNPSESSSTGWDILVLDARHESSTFAHTELLHSVQEDELSAYAISRAGAEKLLSAATAYTVPLHVFITILTRGGKGGSRRERVLVKRWSGATTPGSSKCVPNTQGARARRSDSLPFHPPLHEFHEHLEAL